MSPLVGRLAPSCSCQIYGIKVTSCPDSPRVLQEPKSLNVAVANTFPTDDSTHIESMWR